jgi:hypothetical protein
MNKFLKYKSFVYRFDVLRGRDAYLLLMFWSVRMVFVLMLEPSFEMQDSGRYYRLSDAVLRGDFNFDDGMFIVAPLYPFFMAAHKLLFGPFWASILTSVQIVWSCLAGLALYRMAKMLFHSPAVALVTAVLYAFNPSTLWFAPVFGQEALFMCLLIFSMYFLVISLKTGKSRHALYSALLYSGAFLTKSHVLLFSPFIVLAYMLSRLPQRTKWTLSAKYTLVCLAATVPFGLVNLKLHQTYTLSSNGFEAHFYTGNTEYSYQFFINPPPLTDSVCLLEIRSFPYGFVRYNGEEHLDILSRPQKEKQPLFLKAALRWISENPTKFLRLKLYYLYAFLMPGLDYNYHPFGIWLAAFLQGLPIFAFAYWGMWRAWKENRAMHSWIWGLFAAMTIFSVGFYVQNRFRRCTIEPFYLMYAAYAMVRTYKHIRDGQPDASAESTLGTAACALAPPPPKLDVVHNDGL